jgi:hypothetical protein
VLAIDERMRLHRPWHDLDIEAYPIRAQARPKTRGLEGCGKPREDFLAQVKLGAREKRAARPRHDNALLAVDNETATRRFAIIRERLVRMLEQLRARNGMGDSRKRPDKDPHRRPESTGC